MTEKWAGLKADSNGVTVVLLSYDDEGNCVLEDDHTIKREKGKDIPKAYRVLFEEIKNYLCEQKVTHIAIKASAASKGGAGLSHLLSAEVRGVTIAAAATVTTNIVIIKKATLSRTFGKRKADEYIQDDAFWSLQLEDFEIRKGSREAALLILAARKK